MLGFVIDLNQRKADTDHFLYHIPSAITTLLKC